MYIFFLYQTVHISVYHSISPSILLLFPCLSVCMPFHLFVYLPVCLSTLPVCLLDITMMKWARNKYLFSPSQICYSISQYDNSHHCLSYIIMEKLKKKTPIDLLTFHETHTLQLPSTRFTPLPMIINLSWCNGVEKTCPRENNPRRKVTRGWNFLSEIEVGREGLVLRAR